MTQNQFEASAVEETHSKTNRMKIKQEKKTELFTLRAPAEAARDGTMARDKAKARTRPRIKAGARF